MHHRLGSRHSLRVLCCAVACQLLHGISIATPSVVESDGVYAGILGLSVAGVEYDVTFRYGSYSDNFSSVLPTFLGSPSGAISAATAVQAVMNTMPYRSIWASQPYFGSAYFVPFDRQYDAAREYWQIGFYFLWGDPDNLYTQPIDITPVEAGYQETYREPNYQWAVFAAGGSGLLPPPSAPSGVPEPSTIALIGAALLGIAATHRARTTGRSQP